MQAAAQAIGKQLIILDVNADREIETAFASFVGREAVRCSWAPAHSSTLVGNSSIALAARHKLPAIYPWREAVTAGGLMSYGANITDAYRLVGIYAGRILHGEKPADLPVVQPTKFEFVLNLKTANALGLDVPDRVLALADEVIE